jgi:hypothetical protein
MCPATQESVPRPIAKGGVVTIAFGIALLALKAVLSTFFSVLVGASLFRSLCSRKALQ